MLKPIPAEARVRLAKLLGMLGSAHMGERANAATLASALLRQHGWTWADLASAASGDMPELWVEPSATRPSGDDALDPAAREVRQLAVECLRHQDVLTTWERQFCQSMREWSGSVTDKQLATLRKIAVQMRVRRSAASAETAA